MVLRKQVRTFVKGVAAPAVANPPAVKSAANIGKAPAVGPAKRRLPIPPKPATPPAK